MVRSGRKDSVAQRSMSSTTYPNFSQIGILLHGTVGTPTCRLSGKRDWTEIHRAVPIIDGISAFQVHRIHQQTPLQYSPAPCVRAISSGISRYRNIATASRAHSPAHPLFPVKISSNRLIKTALRSVQCLLKHTKNSARSINSFPERWALQVARYRGTWEITDIHPVLPIIDGISAFQMHRTHRHTILQYSPDRCGPSTCSGLSRYRDNAQNKRDTANIAGSGTSQKSILRYHI